MWDVARRNNSRNRKQQWVPLSWKPKILSKSDFSQLALTVDVSSEPGAKERFWKDSHPQMSMTCWLLWHQWPWIAHRPFKLVSVDINFHLWKVVAICSISESSWSVMLSTTWWKSTWFVEKSAVWVSFPTCFIASGVKVLCTREFCTWADRRRPVDAETQSSENAGPALIERTLIVHWTFFMWQGSWQALMDVPKHQGCLDQLGCHRWQLCVLHYPTTLNKHHPRVHLHRKWHCVHQHFAGRSAVNIWRWMWWQWHCLAWLVWLEKKIQVKHWPRLLASTDMGWQGRSSGVACNRGHCGSRKWQLRNFLMVCQWWVLHSNRADAEARPGASTATKKDMLPRIARQSLIDQSPSAADLMTMTASEVTVERVLTFHKSVRRMSSSQRRWMWAGMMHCVLMNCIFNPQECSWFNPWDTWRTVRRWDSIPVSAGVCLDEETCLWRNSSVFVSPVGCWTTLLFIVVSRKLQAHVIRLLLRDPIASPWSPSRPWGQSTPVLCCCGLIAD